MKCKLLFAITLLFFAEPAFAQTRRVTLTHLRPGESPRRIQAVVTDPAHTVRLTLASCQPGDVLQILGRVNFGREPVVFPDGVSVQGFGPLKTQLYSEKIADEGAAINPAAFVLGRGSELRYMTLENHGYNRDEDAACVGFNGPAAIEGCRLLGEAWLVYSWFGNDGWEIRLKDCDLIFGRIGIAAMSSYDNGHHFIVDNCRFDGDGGRCQDIGNTSNPQHGGVYGVMARNGKVTLRGCSMRLRGHAPQGSSNGSHCPNVAALADKFDAGYGATFEVHDLTSLVEANGSTTAVDFLLKVPRTRLSVFGGWGSGVAGAFTMSNK